jgi:hypothetical protein
VASLSRSFVFIWFWLVILAVITGVQLVYRAVTLYSPVLRQTVLRSNARQVTKRELDILNRKCQFGDWFFLHNIGRNIDHFIFSEFVTDVVRVMDYEQNSNNMEMTPLALDKPTNPDKEKSF